MESVEKDKHIFGREAYTQRSDSKSNDNDDDFAQSLNRANSASRRAREVPKKKENHQNLTQKNMSRSNPVHL